MLNTQKVRHYLGCLYQKYIDIKKHQYIRMFNDLQLYLMRINCIKPNKPRA
jgi:hypothetical protein